MSEHDREEALAERADELSSTLRRAYLAAIFRTIRRSPTLRREYIAAIFGTIRRLVIPPTKELEFSTGVLCAFVVTTLLRFFVFPSAAFMILTLPLTLGTGVAFAWISTFGRSRFTIEDRALMERVEYHRQRTEAINRLRQQLHAAGISAKEIDEKLAPLKAKAWKQLLGDIDRAPEVVHRVGVTQGERTQLDQPGWLSTTRDAPLPMEPQAEVFLNVWFPAFEPNEPQLIVGQVIELCVDLGPSRPGSGPQARALNAAVLAQLREVSWVDVWVQCPDADVTPCEGTLDLRTPGSVLGFMLTPRSAGSLRIVVVLLLRNQPIHRVEREFQVWEPDARVIR